jgi:hypothetical protein
MWSAFAKAIETDLREGTELTGVSGLTHRVDAICVDDKRSRLVVASAEANPRIAALMQVDIQASMPATKVIVARPVAVDFPTVARSIVQELGTAQIDLKAISEQLNQSKEAPTENVALTEAFGSIIGPIASSFQHLSLPPLNQILAAVQQAAMLDWSGIGNALKGSPEDIVIPLAGLLQIDSMAVDRAHGICPIPLYEFSEADWDMFLRDQDADEVRERLRQLDIFQYFFPAADQVALGLAERHGGTSQSIANALELSPDLGHPFGRPELTTTGNVAEVVEQLQDLGLLVEGEFGLEVTAAGSSTRASIKFRPREGFVSKLLQRFNLNVGINPNDFMR